MRERELLFSLLSGAALPPLSSCAAAVTIVPFLQSNPLGGADGSITGNPNVSWFYYVLDKYILRTGTANILLLGSSEGRMEIGLRDAH
jgi:hypothetical protein